MNRLCTILACLLLTGFFMSESAEAQKRSVTMRGNLSAPLPELIAQTSARAVGVAPYAVPNKFKFKGQQRSGDGGGTPGAQRFFGADASAPVLLDFEGGSDAENSSIIGFAIVPPDTEGDVGPDHYVQWINLVAHIFNKAGVDVGGGAFAGNAFWAGFGGLCETTNSGDPVVLYDHLADRWFVSQFAIGATNSMCFAVSTTPDPTGSYCRYEVPFGSDFPDYPKSGVQESGYYFTQRNFAGGFAFTGVEAWALERDMMLAPGCPSALAVGFPIPGGSGIDGYLPIDLDGPSAGASPGLFIGNPGTTGGGDALEIFELDPDFAGGTAGATFTQIADLPVDPFDDTAFSVPQPAPGELLDVLSFATMHRAAYRTDQGHETILANHSVDVGAGQVGIRWYELRDSGGGWSVYQQGTYAPDSENRWMGSIAMQSNGDIALGYSVSSTTTMPAIRFAGKNDGLADGIMNVAEESVIEGTGVQTGSASRWGDYSMMSPDPSDPSTFWFTTEYYATTGSFDFKTRIAHLELGPGLPGTSPVVTITAPLDGDTFASGASIAFAGTATDAEDGDLTASLAWTSSIDGAIGAGGGFSTILSDGSHTISASVTDSDGRAGSDAISITVGTGGGGTCADHTDALMTDGFGFNWCWDRTNLDGAVGPGGADGVTQPPLECLVDGLVDVELSGTLENAFDSASSTGAVCRLADLASRTTQLEAVNEAPDGCTSFSDSFTYDGTRSGNLTYDGTWTSYCFGAPLASGTWSGVFDVSGSQAPALQLGVSPMDGANVIRAKGGKPLTRSDRARASSAGLPASFELDQNYPNPFSRATQISYALPEGAQVSIKVYNLLGREVATLINDYKEAGRYLVRFDDARLSAGVYLYVMKAGDFTATKRLTLLK